MTRASRLLFRLQVHARPRWVRDRIARAVARVLPGAPGPCAEPAGLEHLERRGWVSTGVGLSLDQLTEAKAYLAGRRCQDPWHRERGDFDPSAPPEGVHTGHHHLRDVLSAPHLLALANAPPVLGLVAGYLRCRPTITNLSAWWSYPTGGSPEEAQNFHRDRDDWRFCKLFVYLTDVAQTDGPHVFVEGSHRTSTLDQLRRFSDAEVERAAPPEAIRTFVGPAGTSFLEDTYGLHKGLPPSAGRRMIFQAEYSLFPIPHYTYDPVPAAQVAGSAGLDPYVNRLLFR